jgi:hypothetical protein
MECRGKQPSLISDTWDKLNWDCVARSPNPDVLATKMKAPGWEALGSWAFLLLMMWGGYFTNIYVYIYIDM